MTETAAAQTTTAGRVPGFAPENGLEAAAASDPDIQRGWAFPGAGRGIPSPTWAPTWPRSSRT
jgi:hypothetical protein